MARCDSQHRLRSSDHPLGAICCAAVSVCISCLHRKLLCILRLLLWLLLLLLLLLWSGLNVSAKQSLKTDSIRPLLVHCNGTGLVAAGFPIHTCRSPAQSN